jgi:hypothetical protein
MPPVVNINSFKECETAYLRHLREGDFLSDEQVKEIENRWPGYTVIWENQAQDKVDYSSEDLSYNYNPDDYSDDHEQGWNVGESVAGNVNKAGMTGRAIVDGIVTTGTAAVPLVSKISFGTNTTTTSSVNVKDIKTPKITPDGDDKHNGRKYPLIFPLIKPITAITVIIIYLLLLSIFLNRQ